MLFKHLSIHEMNKIVTFKQIAGTMLFGVLLSRYDPVTCLKFAATLMIGSLPTMVSRTVSMKLLNKGNTKLMCSLFLFFRQLSYG